MLQHPYGGIQADDDWYEIYVSSGYEQVDIICEFSHSQGDIDIALYNASGTMLDSSTGIIDNESISYIVDPASDNGGSRYYYIKVYYANAGNYYTLWWDDTQPGTLSVSIQEEEPEGLYKKKF